MPTPPPVRLMRSQRNKTYVSITPIRSFALVSSQVRYVSTKDKMSYSCDRNINSTMVGLFRMLQALAKNDLGRSSGMDSQRGGGGRGGRVACLASAGTVRLAFTTAAHVA